MNNIFKKIIKGTIAIFAIKLVLVGGLFIFQSCQTDSLVNEDNEEAKSNFLASLKMSNEKLSTITVKNPNKSISINSSIMARDMQEATETVCLQFIDGVNTSDEVVDDILDNIGTVTEIIQTKTSHNLVPQINFNWNDSVDEPSDDSTDDTGESDFNPEDCIALIEIPIQPIADALDPTILEAKNYLYSNGFNDSDIAEVLENNTEGYLISVVSLMIATENSENYTSTSMNHINFLLGIETVNAQNWSKIGGCAKKAFGLDLIDDFKGWKSLKKKARKKLVRKAIATVGAKYVGGWFGAAVIAAEFGLCMA